MTNRSEEVVALQKKMCMSQSQMVKILTFGTDSTFRIMLVLTEEKEKKRIQREVSINTSELAVQAFLSTPQKFAEVMKTVECAHDLDKIESSIIALLAHGNTLAVQALLKTPEKITAAITVFDQLNLADPAMIRMLLANGGRSVIQAFFQAPRQLATAMQTMASANGFEESSMIALLTHGNTLAVQALLETLEKITAAITVFGQLNLADPAMIRVLLANGGRPVI